MIRELFKRIEIRVLCRMLYSANVNSNSYWLRSKITSLITVSEEEYLNTVVLPKIISGFIGNDMKEALYWQEIYCSYVRDHYIVWVFTPDSEHILGKSSERLDRLRDHLQDGLGINTEVRVIGMNYGVLRETMNLEVPE